MDVLRIQKKTSFKVEKAQLLISLICLISGINLSHTEIEALAYYIVYGVKKTTDQQLLSTKVVKRLESLYNLKTRLTKKGFLKKTEGLYNTYEVNLDKNFNLEKISHVIVEIKET